MRFVPSTIFLTADSQRPHHKDLRTTLQFIREESHSVNCLLWGKNLLLGLIGAHVWLLFTIAVGDSVYSKHTLRFPTCWGDEPDALWEGLRESGRHR